MKDLDFKGVRAALGLTVVSGYGWAWDAESGNGCEIHVSMQGTSCWALERANWVE